MDKRGEPQLVGSGGRPYGTPEPGTRDQCPVYDGGRAGQTGARQGYTVPLAPDCDERWAIRAWHGQGNARKKQTIRHHRRAHGQTFFGVVFFAPLPPPSAGKDASRRAGDLARRVGYPRRWARPAWGFSKMGRRVRRYEGTDALRWWGNSVAAISYVQVGGLSVSPLRNPRKLSDHVLRVSARGFVFD